MTKAFQGQCDNAPTRMMYWKGKVADRYTAACDEHVPSIMDHDAMAMKLTGDGSFPLPATCLHVQHQANCALRNEAFHPKGPCDCGAYDPPREVNTDVNFPSLTT